MATVTCNSPAILTTTSLSLNVDDDDELPVVVAIPIPSPDDDGAHTQPSDGWQRSSPAPTSPDNHHIQLHRIDASAPVLESTPFFIFLLSILALLDDPQKPRR